jgi:dihydrofolate synthase/folylpolyglutamate synthase
MHIVTGGQDRGVMEVIKAACSEKNCPLSVIAGADIRIRERSLAGQRFDLNLAGCSLKDLHIRMYGVHQPQNAALAAYTAKLCGMGEKAIRQGLENAQTVSRFEVIPGEPTVILDGAHNVDSAAELKDTLRQYFKDKSIVLLTAVMADKDVEGILKIFAQFAQKAITVRADDARGADAKMLAEILQHYGVDACSRTDIQEAFREARLNAEQNSALLVVSGSFYLTGSVRRFLLPSTD